MGRRRLIGDDQLDAVYSDYLELGTMAAVALKWGVSEPTISRAFQKALFKVGSRGPAKDDRIRSHPKLGVWSDVEMATELGVSRQRIQQIRKELGISPRDIYWETP